MQSSPLEGVGNLTELPEKLLVVQYNLSAVSIHFQGTALPVSGMAQMQKCPWITQDANLKLELSVGQPGPKGENFKCLEQWGLTAWWQLV